jgi:Fe2+ or Zn2+ uptake regulation protein
MASDILHCDHQTAQQAPVEIVDALLARAKESGLRRTRALEDVLRILASSPRPMTLAEIATSESLSSKADKATVYRLLQKLEDRRILKQLGLHDRSAYYAIIFPGQHHDYLICSECGRIEELCLACPVEALEKQVADESGFSGIYHELEFFGICPDCRTS